MDARCGIGPYARSVATDLASAWDAISHKFVFTLQLKFATKLADGESAVLANF